MNETDSALPVKPNGNPGPQTIAVDPVQVAGMTLEFLARCSMQPAERQRYGLCEQMLLAITRGELRVESQPPRPAETRQ